MYICSLWYRHALFTYNTFIKILYMFQALPCLSSGGLRRNCIYAASGIVTLYLHIIHLLKSSTCFEHYPAHLQEVHVVILYMQPLVSSLSAGDSPVHWLRKQFFLNRCTRQSPAESDDTRGCMYTITTWTS